MMAMEYRNAKYISGGRIDAEVNHPQFGWMPITLSPDDEATAELFAIIDASGDAAPYTDEQALAGAKTSKLAEVNQAAIAAVEPLRSKYPQFEIDSWECQEREARAWVADNSVATPMLSRIAEIRGLTMSDLTERVIEKADAYRLFAAEIIGIRQDLEDKIERYTTVHTVNSISWPTE